MKLVLAFGGWHLLIRRITAALRARADALEAVLGIGLLVVGVARFSVGAALIVAGCLLLGAALWPQFRRP